MVDVVIIGGGPAEVSAGTVLQGKGERLGFNRVVGLTVEDWAREQR